MRTSLLLGFALLAIACGDDTNTSGGSGGATSGSASTSSSSPTSSSGGTPTSSSSSSASSGGEGGAPSTSTGGGAGQGGDDLLAACEATVDAMVAVSVELGCPDEPGPNACSLELFESYEGCYAEAAVFWQCTADNIDTDTCRCVEDQEGDEDYLACDDLDGCYDQLEALGECVDHHQNEGGGGSGGALPGVRGGFSDDDD